MPPISGRKSSHKNPLTTFVNTVISKDRDPQHFPDPGASGGRRGQDARQGRNGRSGNCAGGSSPTSEGLPAADAGCVRVAARTAVALSVLRGGGVRAGGGGAAGPGLRD